MTICLRKAGVKRQASAGRTDARRRRERTILTHRHLVPPHRKTAAGQDDHLRTLQAVTEPLTDFLCCGCGLSRIQQDESLPVGFSSLTDNRQVARHGLDCPGGHPCFLSYLGVLEPERRRNLEPVLACDRPAVGAKRRGGGAPSARRRARLPAHGGPPRPSRTSSRPAVGDRRSRDDQGHGTPESGCRVKGHLARMTTRRASDAEIPRG